MIKILHNNILKTLYNHFEVVWFSGGIGATQSEAFSIWAWELSPNKW